MPVLPSSPLQDGMQYWIRNPGRGLVLKAFNDVNSVFGNELEGGQDDPKGNIWIAHSVIETHGLIKWRFESSLLPGQYLYFEDEKSSLQIKELDAEDRKQMWLPAYPEGPDGGINITNEQFPAFSVYMPDGLNMTRWGVPVSALQTSDQKPGQQWFFIEVFTDSSSKAAAEPQDSGC